MINLSSISQAKQEGYILLTTIVLMIMLTVLALTQVSLNTSQTRVAANFNDTEVSFEKTEGALNEAINKLISSAYTSASFLTNSNGLYLLDQSSAAKWTTVNWASSGVISSFNGGTGTQARYIIEQLPSIIQPGQNMKTPTHVYRVTARAVGASGNSSVMLQSTLQIQQ
jgi:type IV pilus assembly protein PilX